MDNPYIARFDWPLAEMVLERFLFLWTAELITVDLMTVNSVFGNKVWEAYKFYGNMVELLKWGDRWRVQKSL